MVPLRNKSVSVRLEEETYLRLRRHSLRSGVPTSALARALIHRWLQEQADQEGGRLCPTGKAPNASGSRGFSAREVRLEWRREVQVVTDSPADGLEERHRSPARVLLG
jgi:hypothetical protein